jgi:excisionase family DNA binding protein
LTTTTDHRFLRIDEAAAAAGVSTPTIRRWMAEGALGYVQPRGPRTSVRIPVAALEALMWRSSAGRHGDKAA